MAQRYEVREVEVHPHASGGESTFELAENERILTTEYRNANRVVMAVMSPTTADRCMGITSNDTRCKKDAQDGSDYCGIHGDDE